MCCTYCNPKHLKYPYHAFVNFRVIENDCIKFQGNTLKNHWKIVVKMEQRWTSPIKYKYIKNKSDKKDYYYHGFIYISPSN